MTFYSETLNLSSPRYRNMKMIFSHHCATSINYLKTHTYSLSLTLVFGKKKKRKETWSPGGFHQVTRRVLSSRTAQDLWPGPSGMTRVSAVTTCRSTQDACCQATLSRCSIVFCTPAAKA